MVDRFIKAYGEAIREHHNSQYERLVATSVGRADELRRRYDGTTSTALSYINAEDIEDPKKRLMSNATEQALSSSSLTVNFPSRLVRIAH